MRWVDEPLTAPSKCAVLPYITGRSGGPYIDTGTELPGKGDQWDQHVYISERGAREVANFVGFHSPETVEALQQIVRDQAAELDERDERIAQLEAVVDAIDAIESADFRARRKTGRPKVKTTEEVAA